MTGCNSPSNDERRTTINTGSTRQLACAGCGQTNAITKRLPFGWKRQGDQQYCAACWGQRYTLRAVTFAVASPLDATWADLDAALHGMWRETTACANWMTAQLALRDTPRLPGRDNKMPPMPRAYLYPEARGLFPALPPQSVAALEQSVTRKYRACRYEVLWTHRASLPSYRYPQLFPVPNQSWSAEWEGDAPAVRVRVAERKFRLRLKGGPRYRRQLGAFRQIASGEGVAGELALYRAGEKLLCKLVAWLPRPAAAPGRQGTLVVRTAADALLMALNLRDQCLWTYHADHVRRWVAEHRAQLQRWADDTKAEARPVPPFAARRAQAAKKYGNRMRSAAYQAAAYVVGYAARHGFADLRYDDRERSYCPEFPWGMLRNRLTTVADERGLSVAVASGEVKAERSEPLAEE